MKQILLLFLGVILFIIAVGTFSKISLKSTPSTSLSKKEITIGSTKLTVEIANEESQRQKGLGGRESLSEGTGMLFVFPAKTETVNFWMKDMKFPIDIIWIADDKTVKIDKNAAVESGVADNKLKLYAPESAINYVLEVNAGFSDKNNLKVGDSFLLTP